MRGRRTMTVRIMAASGVAASVVGLMTPGSRLWAQKPEAPAEKAVRAEPTLEIPTTRVEGAISTPLTVSPVGPEADPQPAVLPPATARTAKGTTAAAPGPFTPEGTLADPEGEAKAFVEKSRKEADEVIRALNKEAETLRARLQKVEAGLARWQAVKDSLGATDVAGRPSWRARAVPGTVVPPGARDEPPTILDPLPAGTDEPVGRSRATSRDDSEVLSRPAVPDDEPRPAKGAVKPPEVPKSTGPGPAEPQPKGVVLRPPTAPRRVE